MLKPLGQNAITPIMSLLGLKPSFLYCRLAISPTWGHPMCICSKETCQAKVGAPKCLHLLPEKGRADAGVALCLLLFAPCAVRMPKGLGLDATH